MALPNLVFLAEMQFPMSRSYVWLLERWLVHEIFVRNKFQRCVRIASSPLCS